MERGSGPLQPFDDHGHQPKGRDEGQQKGNGHRLRAIAIIIGSLAGLGAQQSLQRIDASALSPISESLADHETLLFVYGTLKRGQPNHNRLKGSCFLGRATLAGACLFDLGPFPMAVAGQGWVVGELYGISWSALPDLDAFEGCPRLYQRHWCSLVEGPQAWVYLGQPRQVRHVRRLEGGHWPSGDTARCAEPLSSSNGRHWSGDRRVLARWVLAPWVLVCTFVGVLPRETAFAGAFDTLGACQAWQSSHGLARVELGNAIGAAHYLTKRHPFQESTPEAPQELYSPADIRRVCDVL